ncbi:MAG: glutamate 5-kinase [Alphaproteobacteria bacterium]|jgi:glutamate 5-kinase
MTYSNSSRPSNIAPWHRAVIKVGSALVSPDGEGCSAQYLKAISDFIIACKQQGKEIIVVSSGSIAAARGSIKTGLKPTIAEKQAMAAIGQMRMMANWAGLFSPFPLVPPLLPEDQDKSHHNIDCAQILVTVEDLADRKRFVNIKNTLEQLLANNVIPIVNENDTVAVEEIKVGDNDNLAAHTAIAAQADCLIICTDVDGLFTANPRTSSTAELIKQVHLIDASVMTLAGGAGSLVGTGGMITKLQAAQKCTQSGIQTLLVNGTKASSFSALLQDECSGTIFTPTGNRQRAKQYWLTHTSKVKGKLLIDAGAAKAISKAGASLLAAGVVTIEGAFRAGDSVEIIHAGSPCGKGLVNYSSTELKRILGCKSDQIETILGYSASEAVVHRDNLVLAVITP